MINGAIEALSWERATLLFFLCYDKESEIKAAAINAFKHLSAESAAEAMLSPDINPRVAELLGRFHPGLNAVSPPLQQEPQASPQPVPRPDSEPPAPEEETPETEDEEEFRSKYQMAQTMGVGEKIKMALTGDKEWRSILIKDSNKLVNGSVVKNPRITEPEILAISKSVIQNDEIIRVICHNKEWVKNYEIRKALVLNHKTPLPIALRFMGFLSEKDLGGMAKSKNISSVLANQARRMLSNKKKD
ncbi:MAG: hypothetical protein FIA91_07070 [Geobacter sp.]|nr:hypothetical protein [Geobacter sp.]